MMQHINLEFSCLYRAQGEKVVVSLVKGNLSQMHLFQFGEYLANSGRSFPVHQIPVEKFYRPEKKRLKLENHNFEKGKLSFIHLYHFAFQPFVF